MVISKILNYQKHIKTIFRPLIDLKINNLKSGVNNGATNNIVISLTTYGRRLKDVKYTLFSLFNQTLKPDRIVLWLDNELNSDKTQKLLHTFIQNGLEIKFTKDIPSWKRMCYCILTNDHMCRSMGFGLSRQKQRHVDSLRKKYQNIIKNYAHTEMIDDDMKR